MIKVQKNAIANFTLTTRLIINGSLKRGWVVYTYEIGSSHLYIDRGDGKKIHILGSILPTLRFATGVLVNDKYLTCKLLEDLGVRQLKTIKVSADDPSIAEFSSFLEGHPLVVVKPVDGAHGNGVTTNVTSVDQMQEAINFAKMYSNTGMVIVQEQFTAETIFDLRILCMSGKFVAAIQRIPARVIGDGELTVEQLIVKENARVDRGEPYKEKYVTIDLNSARKYLKEAIQNIPQRDVAVQVVGTANYGTGGELIDVTDDIPDWMKVEAEKVAKELQIPVIGIDYVTNKAPEKSLKRSEVDAFILEVNKGPSLCIHDQPHEGKNRKTVEKYLDMVALL